MTSSTVYPPAWLPTIQASANLLAKIPPLSPHVLAALHINRTPQLPACLDLEGPSNTQMLAHGRATHLLMSAHRTKPSSTCVSVLPCRSSTTSCSPSADQLPFLQSIINLVLKQTLGHASSTPCTQPSDLPLCAALQIICTPPAAANPHNHVLRQAAHPVPDPRLRPALQIIRLFLQPINDHSDSGDYFQLVEPMGYRIPSCLIYMGCSATLGDRLFLGGNDGHLYELQHSKGHPSMRLVRGVPACSCALASGG